MPCICIAFFSWGTVSSRSKPRESCNRIFGKKCIWNLPQLKSSGSWKKWKKSIYTLEKLWKINILAGPKNGYFRFHVNFPGFTQLSMMFFSYMRFGCCEISWRMVDCWSSAIMFKIQSKLDFCSKTIWLTHLRIIFFRCPHPKTPQQSPFHLQEIQHLKAECRELSSKLEASELQRKKILREQQEVQEASKQTAAWLPPNMDQFVLQSGMMIYDELWLYIYTFVMIYCDLYMCDYLWWSNEVWWFIMIYPHLHVLAIGIKAKWITYDTIVFIHWIRRICFGEITSRQKAAFDPIWIQSRKINSWPFVLFSQTYGCCWTRTWPASDNPLRLRKDHP